MLLTKCSHDTADIFQLKSSTSSSLTFSGLLPLRTVAAETTTTPPSKTTTKSRDILCCCCCLLGNTGTKCRNALKIRLRVKYNLFVFLLINLLLKTCCGQLLINVQNQVSFGVYDLHLFFQ